MMKMIRTGEVLRRFIGLSALTALLAMAVMPTAQAQLTIDVTTNAGRQVPVAIAPFANETNAPQNITPVISANLARTGLFRMVNMGGIIKMPTEPSEINFLDWTSRSAEALVIGTMVAQPDGRFEIRVRLFDVAKQNQLAIFSYVATASQLRATAHKISDEIYEKLIGEKGIFHQDRVRTEARPAI